jgi:adenylate cyclase
MPASAQTFLFMDLVGYTALTAERGDDSAADVAHRFYGQVRALLAHHDAEEIKTIGDAMMLRSEDPRCAIELGVGIVERIGLADELPPVRVGVHTGTAVCREGDWYGSAVNVAARLCSAAGGDEVLVSEDTRAAAGTLDGVELGARQLHWLKNVPEPVAAWPAFAAAVEPDRPRLRLGVTVRSGLINRARGCPTSATVPAPGASGEVTA